MGVIQGSKSYLQNKTEYETFTKEVTNMYVISTCKYSNFEVQL